MRTKRARTIYQLKIQLRGMDPPISRRVEVWEDTALAQLHRILQIVMGWEDYHLHEFSIGRRTYSVPDPDDDLCERKVIDERRVRLKTVVERHIRHLPILDSDGRVLGMLSLRNLLQSRVDDLSRELDSLESYLTADGPGG